MKNLLFKKFSGAGNDFVLVDRAENPSISLDENLIKRICNRRTGVGADGLLLVDFDSQYDFDLKYYNSNGLIGSLCGNGSRCAIQYAELAGKLANSECSFFCNDEVFNGKILGEGKVCFHLSKPDNVQVDLNLTEENYNIKGSFVDTGSPHFVVFIDENKSVKPLNYELENIDVKKFGLELRNNEIFAPAGTNVNFIQVKSNMIKIRTFERGVEDETLACGTGSVAAAIIAGLKLNMQPPVKLVVKSGETLTVDFKKNGNDFSDVSLTGPADLIFTGEFYL